MTHHHCQILKSIVGKLVVVLLAGRLINLTGHGKSLYFTISFALFLIVVPVGAPFASLPQSFNALSLSLPPFIDQTCMTEGRVIGFLVRERKGMRKGDVNSIKSEMEIFSTCPSPTIIGEQYLKHL